MLRSRWSLCFVPGAEWLIICSMGTPSGREKEGERERGWWGGGGGREGERERERKREREIPIDRDGSDIVTVSWKLKEWTLSFVESPSLWRLNRPSAKPVAHSFQLPLWAWIKQKLFYTSLNVFDTKDEVYVHIRLAHTWITLRVCIPVAETPCASRFFHHWKFGKLYVGPLWELCTNMHDMWRNAYHFYDARNWKASSQTVLDFLRQTTWRAVTVRGSRLLGFVSDKGLINRQIAFMCKKRIHISVVKHDFFVLTAFKSANPKFFHQFRVFFLFMFHLTFANPLWFPRIYLFWWSLSYIFLFKKRTGGEKDDNNGISDVSVSYTFFREK